VTENELTQAIDQIKTASMNAVRLDRRILKKTWGFYYMIWATAITLFSTIYIPLENISNTVYQDILFFTAYGIVFIVAIFVTMTLFRRAYMIGQINSGFKGKNRRNEIRSISINVLLFILILFLASGILKYPEGVIGLFFVLVLIYIGMLGGIKQSMGKIPFEGYLSSGAFLFSAVSSTVSLFLNYGYLVYGLLWLVSSAMWFLSGYISLRDYRKMVNGADESLRVD
jgi:hypothetical protein